MGSVLYKEDRLRESVEHYKIAVALAPTDRYVVMANTLYVPLILSLAAAPAAALFVFILQLRERRQSLLSLANTLGDAYRQEESYSVIEQR